MSELTVFLRGYAIDVNITNVITEKESHNNPECYDLEYDVLAVFDDGEERISDVNAQEWAERNKEEIADQIWHELERQS